MAISIDALNLAGKADRVDESEGMVRVIDYKTGTIEAKAEAYYTGRKLQLELYLKAASEGETPAGAFYFPAADEFTKEGEKRFSMTGFYCKDAGVIDRMDTAHAPAESEYFRADKDLDHGMDGETFARFPDYGLLVARGAEEEMRGGNIRPAPYEKVCGYCDLKGMCGFSGTPRAEKSVTCKEIAQIVAGKEGKDA